MGKWFTFFFGFILSGQLIASQNEGGVPVLNMTLPYGFQAYTDKEESRLNTQVEKIEEEMRSFLASTSELTSDVYAEKARDLSKKILPEIVKYQSPILRYGAYRHLATIFYEPVFFRVAYNMALQNHAQEAPEIYTMAFNTISELKINEPGYKRLIQSLGEMTLQEQAIPHYTDLEKAVYCLNKFGFFTWGSEKGLKRTAQMVGESLWEQISSRYTTCAIVFGVAALCYF